MERRNFLKGLFAVAGAVTAVAALAPNAQAAEIDTLAPPLDDVAATPEQEPAVDAAKDDLEADSEGQYYYYRRPRRVYYRRRVYRRPRRVYYRRRYYRPRRVYYRRVYW